MFIDNIIIEKWVRGIEGILKAVIAVERWYTKNLKSIIKQKILQIIYMIKMVGLKVFVSHW